MKRPTKRKMYQKRRKKEKAEQRKKESQMKLPGTPSAAAYKYNNNNTIKSYQRNHNYYPTSKTNNPAINPISSYSQGLQLWWQTYCSAIAFHTKQHNAFQDDNKDHQLMLLEKYANEYETSSEEEDDNEDFEETTQAPSSGTNLDYNNMNDDAAEEHVNEEYIQFLEITLKHREELRLKRAEDNI